MRSHTLLRTTGARRQSSAILAACVLVLSGAMSFAQAPMPPMSSQTQNAVGTGDQNKQLIDQIAELRAQVAKLQAAVQPANDSKKSMAKPGKGMPMMEDKGEMAAMPPSTSKKPMAKPAMNIGSGKMPMMMEHDGEMGAMPGKQAMSAMKDEQGEMGGMSGGAQSSPPMAPAAAMGMCCMGGMGGMSGGSRAGMGGMGGGAAQPSGGMAGMSASSSATPAQPGASHLYHIGSTGFFLNHPQHITLTQDQKMILNRLKEKAMFERASTQRRIDQNEQELYALTGADQPDTSKIQVKIGEIEKLRGDERMNFIRTVGEATNVLSHEQHLALMGTMAAASKK